MSSKPKEPSRADNPDRWMISYADLLTLTLAFFIVMYAQSHTDVAKLQKVANAIAIAFHGNPSVLVSQAHGGSGVLDHQPSAVHPPVHVPPASMTPKLLRELAARAGALRMAEAKLALVLGPLIAAREVRLKSGPLSLRINLNSRILFENGDATLQPSAVTVLTKVADVIRQIPPNYPVVIQGYTNKIPIATAQFPSNWELSSARAISVLHLFRDEQIPGTQLSVQGFGQYHPLKSMTGAQAIEANRRVEIVILAPSAGGLGGPDIGAATSGVPAGESAD